MSIGDADYLEIVEENRESIEEALAGIMGVDTAEIEVEGNGVYLEPSPPTNTVNEKPELEDEFSTILGEEVEMRYVGHEAGSRNKRKYQLVSSR